MAIYRLRITDTLGNRSYIVKYDNGKVCYMSASETPLSLSNLVGNEAAELRFALEGTGSKTNARRLVIEARARYTRLPAAQFMAEVEVI